MRFRLYGGNLEMRSNPLAPWVPASLSALTGDALGKANQALSGLSTQGAQLGTMQIGYNTLSGIVTAHTLNLASLQTGLTGANAALTGLSGTVGNHTTTLAGLQTSLGTLQAGQTTAAGQIATLTTGQATINTQLGTLAAGQTTLTAGQTTLANNLAAALASINALQSGVASMSGSMATQSNVSTMTAQLSALQAALNALATVATTGSYTDLANKPQLFTSGMIVQVYFSGSGTYTPPTGWVELKGQLKSTLTATQQAVVTALGIGSVLPITTAGLVSRREIMYVGP